MSIAGTWSGVTWGDATGGVVLAMQASGQSISGDILLNEPGIGQTRAKLRGEVLPDGRVTATLDSFSSDIQPQTVVLPTAGTLEGQYSSNEGSFEGTWTTDVGTSGKFALIRTLDQPPKVVAMPAAPLTQAAIRVPPLHNRTDTLGSYRLDTDDLRGLADIVRTGTKVLQPAINITSEGRGFIHVGVESVVADSVLPNVVYDVFISANEPVIGAGHKIVALTFKRSGPNVLFVSDYDRTWVEGKAAEVKEFLRGRESKAARFLSKYGPSINSIVFLTLLAVLPSISSLKHRFEIVATSGVLLSVLAYSWRLAVSFKAYLRQKKLPWYEQYQNVWLTAISLVLTGLVTYLIARYVAH